MKKTLFALTLVFVAGMARAGEFSLGLLGGDTSGDRGRRDDLAAFRQGLWLGYRQGAGLDEFKVNVSPTQEGKLVFSRSLGEDWRFKVEFQRSRRYSDTSTYPERTPLGTPVSQLYPFTNTLGPAFGRIWPVESRNTFRAEITYGQPWQGASLTWSGFHQGGDRTTQVGGIAFGDFSAPAFFPAGLSQIDSDRFEVAARAWKRAGPFWIHGEVGGGSFQVEQRVLLPTYGRDALLDVAALEVRNDADQWHGSLAAGFAGRYVTILGNLAYAKVDTTPGFASGTRPGPVAGQLSGASGDVTAKSASAGLLARPWPWLLVRASARAHSEARSARGTESFFATALGASAAKVSETSGEIEAAARAGVLSARVRGGVADGTDRFRLSHGLRFENYEADLSKSWFSGELALSPGSGWKVRLSGESRRRERTLSLRELVFGYATGDSVRRVSRLRADVTKSWSSLDFGLSVASSWGKDSWQPPLYDPIYDPSWSLEEAQGKVDRREATVHLVYTGGERWSAWLEGGYRKEEWRFDAVTFPGFLWVGERLEGWTVGIGASSDLTATSHLSFAASLDAPTGSVAHRWGWADATFVQDLRKNVAVFARIFARRFDERRYRLDDFTLKALSVGIQGRF